MFNNKITAQINELLPSPPAIIGEGSLRHDFDDLINGIFPKMQLCVVDDKQTSSVLGDRIFRAVKDNSLHMRENQHLTLQGLVAADLTQIELIREYSQKCDALIAVGGGTINDLCKYAAHLEGKPYLIFPTAASMNGYLSANASISVNGHKTTLPAQLPQAIFCDFAVIADAPLRLTKSGLGDSLARPTAQADWLLSHLLLQTAYNENVFTLLADIEAEVFDNAGGIAVGDVQVIKLLTQLLLLSGLGMTIAGGSYPASQGEHMIAHTYNMLSPHIEENIDGKLPILHGEEIAITSLHMAKVQENFLYKKPKLSNAIFPEEKMQSLFSEKLTGEFRAEFAKKNERCKNVEMTAANWENIAEKIAKISIPPQQLTAILQKAKAPILPKDIGWCENNLEIACEIARFTRDRFTFLDFVKVN
jgi:glycerol-1-phosphate dehydrogenase [NAD(P)+]